MYNESVEGAEVELAVSDVADDTLLRKSETYSTSSRSEE